MTILSQLLKRIYYKFLQLRIYIFLYNCKKVGKGIQLAFPLSFEGKYEIEIGDHVSIVCTYMGKWRCKNWG